jgi:hypothetical protein
MTGCTIDTLSRTIKVATGFTSVVAAGDSVAITIGTLANPVTQSNPGTFTLSSYTDSTLIYYID